MSLSCAAARRSSRMSWSCASRTAHSNASCSSLGDRTARPSPLCVWRKYRTVPTASPAEAGTAVIYFKSAHLPVLRQGPQAVPAVILFLLHRPSNGSRCLKIRLYPHSGPLQKPHAQRRRRGAALPSGRRRRACARHSASAQFGRLSGTAVYSGMAIPKRPTSAKPSA